MEKNAIATLKSRGLQSRLSMRTHVARSTVAEVFNGKRRATVRQAAVFEEQFLRWNIPLNRWDLLYGVRKGQSLTDYLTEKAAEGGEAK